MFDYFEDAKLSRKIFLNKIPMTDPSIPNSRKLPEIGTRTKRSFQRRVHALLAAVFCRTS